MFFTVYARDAGAILKDQDQRSRTDDQAMINNCTTRREAFVARKHSPRWCLHRFEPKTDHVHSKQMLAVAGCRWRIDEWYTLAAAWCIGRQADRSRRRWLPYVLL